MVFPVAVDDFQRTSLFRYDGQGYVVSAGYASTQLQAPIVATTYVYPSPALSTDGVPIALAGTMRRMSCNSEFLKRKNAVAAAHPDARPLGERDVASPAGAAFAPGKMAAYEFQDSFSGRQQPLHFELYVYCYLGGRSTFEYQFSSPQPIDASARIASFMKNLVWTVPPER